VNHDEIVFEVSQEYFLILIQFYVTVITIPSYRSSVLKINTLVGGKRLEILARMFRGCVKTRSYPLTNKNYFEKQYFLP